MANIDKVIDKLLRSVNDIRMCWAYITWNHNFLLRSWNQGQDFWPV